MRIYGPYLREDGRKHIILIYPDGTRRTKSYPKFLLEQKIGRELTVEETCDHIDDDYTNDDPSNLQVLTRKENAKKEILREHRRPKLVEAVCPNCSVNFEVYKSRVADNIRKNKAGPFCSKKCAGTYGTNIQRGSDFVIFL